MKATKITHSSSGSYYENGHMYPASSGCVSMEVCEEMHGATLYWHHFYANGGDMKQQIKRDEYLKLLAGIVASHGTKHPRYGCEMKVWMGVETREVSGYDWTGRDAMPINFGLGRR